MCGLWAVESGGWRHCTQEALSAGKPMDEGMEHSSKHMSSLQVRKRRQD